MKRIRQKSTGLYFVHGKWTSEFSMAQTFAMAQQAQVACEEHQLEHVELLYCFGDTPTRWDFAVPLAGARK
jgi:hypothetical protein